jgi:hypothetical protein
MNIITSKIIRVPLISVLTGIIISKVSSIAIYLMVRGTDEWTTNMNITLYTIKIIVAVLLFIITGLFCYKDMNKLDIAKSATIVVIYYVVVVLIEQFYIHKGQYPIFLLWVFTPVNIYTIICNSIFRFIRMSIWVDIILTSITPFSYVLFGSQVKNYTKEN